MKTVLILAYDFPPYVSVGGLRPHYWFENFNVHNIQNCSYKKLKVYKVESL